MMFWCCLTFIFGIFLTCHVKRVQCQETFPELLHSTRKLLDYYKQNYKDLNLDGLFGLRILEGEAEQILQNSADRLDIEVKTFLQNVLEESRNISELSLPYVQRDDQEYFTRLAPLVKAPILRDKPHRRIDPLLLWDKDERHPSVVFTEEKSDDCFTELLTASQAPSCEVSMSCLEMVSEKGLRDYGVTHQLLYTMVTEQGRCRQRLESYLVNKGFSGGIQEFQLNLCTNIFFEVSQLVKKFSGEVRPVLQDLFLEQEFVCAMLGFMEFLHIDWLRQIISWQKPSGCYGKMPRVTRLENLPSDIDYEYIQPPDSARDGTGDIDLSNRLNRQFELPPNPQRVEDNSNLRLQNQEQQVNVINQNQQNVYNNLNQGYNYNVGNRDQGIGGGERLIEQPKQIMEQPQQPPVQIQQQQPVLAQQQFQQQALPAQQNFQQQQQNQFMQPMNQQDNNAGNILPNNNVAQDWNNNGAQPIPRNIENIARDGAKSNNMYNNQLVNQDAVIQQNVGNRHLLYVHTDKDNTSAVYLREIQRVSRDMPNVMEHLNVGRKLLVEKSMEGDCLSHKTGVAAGAISQYLRYYLDPGPPEFSSAVHLSGVNYLLQPSAKIFHQAQAQGQGRVDTTTPKVGAGEGPVDLHQEDYHGNYHESEYNLEDGGLPPVGGGRDDVAKQQDVLVAAPHGNGVDDSHYDGDNEDKPQDYYNEDDDKEDNENEEDEGDEEDKEDWKNVAPPPFGGLNERQNLENGDEGALYINGGEGHDDRYHDNNNGDQEYAQYIDDKEDLLEEGAVDVNPKHGPVLGKDGAPAGGDKYPYYYNQADLGLESPGAGGDRERERAVEGPQPTAKPPEAVVKVAEKPDSGVSVGTSYAILLVVMLTLLYYMNKFVRRRRILIKYR